MVSYFPVSSPFPVKFLPTVSLFTEPPLQSCPTPSCGYRGQGCIMWLLLSGYLTGGQLIRVQSPPRSSYG